MERKPRKLTTPSRIRNLRLRKKPLTKSEQRELLDFDKAYQKRLKERDEWDMRQEELKELDDRKRIEARQEKFRNKARCAYHMVLGALESPVEDTNILARLIGSVIREVKPHIQVNWWSKEYKKQVKQAKKLGHPKPKATHEHIYPMQFNGEFIISHIKVTELTWDQFFNYACVFNQVAFVTREENSRLGSRGDAPQRAHNFLCPEQAYIDAKVAVEFNPILRLDEVAPREVLQYHFGDRYKELHKYKC